MQNQKNRQQLAKTAKAIDHPVRGFICELLTQNPNGLTVNTITDMCRKAKVFKGHCEQPAISAHLKKLADVGIVDFHKSGKEHIYQISAEMINHFDFVATEYSWIHQQGSTAATTPPLSIPSLSSTFKQ